MTLFKDLHHLAFVTSDMDRLLGFYQRVLNAETVDDIDEEGLRHAFIRVGPHTVLHPFQIPGIPSPDTGDMFQRGRLDHFAFNASSNEAFFDLCTRVVDEGAGDGVVTDMGILWTFSFTDPDGMWCEVVWELPNAPSGATGRRSEWKTLDLP